MGLKDKLNAAKGWMWSPMSVELLEKGSDEFATVGETARVIVYLTGEDDGTGERVEVHLRFDSGGERQKLPLGELPATLGRHELDVVIPPGLPPSCGGFTEYCFVGILERTKGTPSEGVSPVRILGRAEDLYWPEDRGGTVQLDSHTADIGKSVSGRAEPGAKVELRCALTRFEQVAGKSQLQLVTKHKTFTEATVGDDGRFSLEIPEGVPPTLQAAKGVSAVWEVRSGDAFTVVGMLDPDALGTPDERKAMSLYDLFF